MTLLFFSFRISAQRIVLTASSKYFRAMFTSGMKESEKKEIPLENVSGEALRLIIQYCYTGEIEINVDNVEMLLPAASHLEFVEIEKECSKFLEIILEKNPLNCLSYYLTGFLYNFDGLMMLAKQLMCKHFMEIKDAEEFLLLEFDVLLELIGSDDLKVDREEDAFNAVMKWVNHEQSSRKQYLADLLKSIRFSQMDVTVSTF